VPVRLCPCVSVNIAAIHLILALMEQAHQKIIIITAPSGAGKTSITKQLMKRFPQLSFSISAATRKPRAHETDGKDYYFMSVEAFQQKIQEDAFVEWEMVYEGNYYGTLKSEMQRIWNNQQVPVLDIDVKGAIHVQDIYPKQTLSVFIEPPSVEELRRRLESRGTETADSLEARVNKASYEISFKHSFQHVILNDDLDRAIAEAISIVGNFITAS
jgi:guanylate kinase